MRPATASYPRLSNHPKSEVPFSGLTGTTRAGTLDQIEAAETVCEPDYRKAHLPGFGARRERQCPEILAPGVAERMRTADHLPRSGTIKILAHSEQQLGSPALTSLSRRISLRHCARSMAAAGPEADDRSSNLIFSIADT